MLNEEELVPYQVSPLPPGPWLVLAPHPDDETLGLGGALALAQKKGLQVHVVFVSHGELAGDPFQRQKEALKALSIFQIRNFSFWGLPDRKIFKHLESFQEKFLKIFTSKIKSIFVPSIFEYHPDHRAVSWGTIALLQELTWPGEVWFYEVARQGEINRLLDISAVIEKKKQALLCYQSQLSQNAYLEIGLCLNRARAYTLGHQGVTYAEGFFACKALDFPSSLAEQLKKYFR